MSCELGFERVHSSADNALKLLEDHVRVWCTTEPQRELLANAITQLKEVNKFENKDSARVTDILFERERYCSPLTSFTHFPFSYNDAETPFEVMGEFDEKPLQRFTFETAARLERGTKLVLFQNNSGNPTTIDFEDGWTQFDFYFDRLDSTDKLLHIWGSLEKDGKPFPMMYEDAKYPVVGSGSDPVYHRALGK